MYKVTLKIDFWEASFTFPDMEEAAVFADAALTRTDKEILVNISIAEDKK